MRVVDSSIWIEWLTKGPLAETIAPELPQRHDCIVPTIVQLELAKWLGREMGEEAVDNFIAYTTKCAVVPLDTTLARHAAEISSTQKLAMADAIIYATAEHYDADILTCDAHFKDLQRVVYFGKQA